jgi:hypothetical protein
MKHTIYSTTTNKYLIAECSRSEADHLATTIFRDPDTTIIYTMADDPYLPPGGSLLSCYPKAITMDEIFLLDCIATELISNWPLWTEDELAPDPIIYLAGSPWPLDLYLRTRSELKEAAQW